MRAEKEIIGYLPVDKERYVMRRAGSLTDEAYHSQERVVAVAGEWGQTEELLGYTPLTLDDILDRVISEMDDVLLDGKAAQRLIAASQTGGYPYDKQQSKRVKESEQAARYSSRKLLGISLEML